MSRERVTAEAVLQGRFRKASAWDIITDYTRYPSIMESVDRVDIRQRSRSESISHWEVTVEGAPLQWTEKDLYNHESCLLQFDSLEGDFEFIGGKWLITDRHDTGIQINFDIDYDLGIPVIEEVLGPILKEKMQNNIESMLGAVRDEIGQIDTEERKHTRIGIEKCCDMQLDERCFRAYIENISRGGIMLRYDTEFRHAKGMLKIDGVQVGIQRVHTDMLNKVVRIEYDRLIESIELENMCRALDEYGDLTSSDIEMFDVVAVKPGVRV
jgi:ribosome-associated toxin RatA of RatAB toxin-antitoxin module